MGMVWRQQWREWLTVKDHPFGFSKPGARATARRGVIR